MLQDADSFGLELNAVPFAIDFPKYFDEHPGREIARLKQIIIDLNRDPPRFVLKHVILIPEVFHEPPLNGHIGIVGRVGQDLLHRRNGYRRLPFLCEGYAGDAKKKDDECRAAKSVHSDVRILIKLTAVIAAIQLFALVQFRVNASRFRHDRRNRTLTMSASPTVTAQPMKLNQRYPIVDVK